MRTTLPRTAPLNPKRLIRGSTVQRGVGAFALHLSPNFIRAVDLKIGLPDASDLGDAPLFE